MKGQASLEEIAGFFGSYVSPSDVYGAKWLGRYMDKGRKIATDFSPAVCYYGMIPRYNHIYCSSLESMRNCIESENIYILLKGHNFGLSTQEGKKQALDENNKHRFLIKEALNAIIGIENPSDIKQNILNYTETIKSKIC